MVGQKIWLKCTDGNSYSYVNLCRLLCRCTTLTQQIEKTKAEHSQYVEVNLSIHPVTTLIPQNNYANGEYNSSFEFGRNFRPGLTIAVHGSLQDWGILTKHRRKDSAAALVKAGLQLSKKVDNSQYCAIEKYYSTE
ncbi:hypothetical protein RB195_019686 [Necator americanus]|uniref:Uncharacterized protein n=1 Tax=Necator americanus TaxID=51031 RepID=A0ABR1CIW5_NECAM